MDRFEFASFLDRYNNYYHYYALDGHEANDDQRAILADYAYAIRFHEYVQFEILGRIYFDAMGQEQAYAAAGRIDTAEAHRRLKQFCREYDIASVFRFLESRVRALGLNEHS